MKFGSPLLLTEGKGDGIEEEEEEGTKKHEEEEEEEIEEEPPKKKGQVTIKKRSY